MTFVDFNIRHRSTSLRKLYFVTLTYFLKVKNLVNLYISATVSASAKTCEDICTIWHLPSNGVFAKIAFCDLDLLLKVKNNIYIYIYIYISETGRAIEKIFEIILYILTFTIKWFISKIVLRDLDLLFQDKKNIFKISETVRASEKMCSRHL